MNNDLSTGEAAPDFTTTTDTGEIVSLSDLRGKKVVLYFYPKDDTPGCTKQACGFRDNKDNLDEENLVVLGVSADDMDSHHRFIDKFDLNFPLLADVDKTVINAYGVWGEKVVRERLSVGIKRKTFLIDEEGTIMKA